MIQKMPISPIKKASLEITRKINKMAKLISGFLKLIMNLSVSTIPFRIK